MIDAFAAACDYIERGWAPIPVPFRTKGPLLADWQTVRMNAETAPNFFNGAPQNIGIILGAASAGLCDLDLDCSEAMAAAPYILPGTALFGHASKRGSHWIYRSNLCDTQDRAALKFMGSDRHGLLEVRMGARGLAAQTIFPPSVHVNGEPIEWEDGGPDKITDIDGDELLQRARHLAAAAEIARNYPNIGGRHDAAFVLGGFLARCGLSPPAAAVFVEAVAAASLQPGDKRRDMARTACDGASAEKRAGFPLLAETFGADTAKKVANWLDYKGGDEGSVTGVQGENAADRPPLLLWYGADPPPPPKYLVSNMLPEDGVALIGGQFLLGKTFVGADLSAAVMTCGVFAGEPVMRKGAILGFAAEGEKEIEGRVRAAVENKFGGAGPQPFARQAAGVPLLTDPEALEKLKAHAQEAAKYAREKFGLPLALIVIDTVSAAAGFTDENSASETQKVMTTLRELSRATGALVLPIDHYGKQTETGIRGSSAKSAAADAILACLGERDNEGVVSNHRLAVTKLRNGPTGRVIPFELRQTETEFGSTCVVDWRLTAVEAAPVEKPKAWPKSLVIFKRALQNALTDFGARMRPFADNLEVLVVDREKVRAEFMRAYPADNRKAKGESFRRCEIEAVKRGFIVSRSIGEDLAATVFWLVRDDP
jgi:AAA domain/Bifunctional DNA primase/polymerase, N-terminal